MSSTTHEIELRVAIDINEIINENTISALAILFNTNNPEELLASYGQYIVDEMMERTKTRSEFTGYNARIIQIDNDELLDSDIDEVVEEEAEGDTLIFGEPNDTTLATLDLIDSIYSKNRDIQDDGGKLSKLIISDKYKIETEMMELDTDVPAKLITQDSIGEYDYKLIKTTNDGQEHTEQIKLPKGEN